MRRQLRGPTPYFYHGVIAYILFIALCIFLLGFLPSDDMAATNLLHISRYLQYVFAGFGLVYFLRRGNPGIEIRFRHLVIALAYGVAAVMLLTVAMCYSLLFSFPHGSPRTPNLNSSDQLEFWQLVGYFLLFASVGQFAIALMGVWVGFKILIPRKPQVDQF